MEKDDGKNCISKDEKNFHPNIKLEILSKTKWKN